ncbi:MAG: family transcriptional regulator, cyclic receptor protein [Blastocatellia bacterium]|nr:family transcriptional regulator, cyclic receptor protein [Blastocatellia bacterium]
MATPTPQEMTLDALRSVPLFASLDDAAAVELRSLLRTRDVTTGTVLFRAGDDGDAMYLIESGRVRIAVTDEDQHEIVLAELAQGDFFGEMAIIDGKQRSADAVIIEDARLAVLSRDNFLRFIRNTPMVALEMLSATFSRLRSTDRMLQQRVSRNVNEEQAKRSTIADRMADHLAEFGGSWKFIGFAVGVIISWIVFNSYVLIKGFDPAPYQMLNLVMGIIAGLQAPIIMMSQNRQSEKDRLRADLDYQVNLKNELSLTEVLRRLDVLESERLPLLFAEQKEHIAKLQSPAALVSTSTTN